MPIRPRVTLAFTGVMTILLIGLGLFIYARYGSRLDEGIDQGLRLRTAEAIAAVDGPGRPFASAGEGLQLEAEEGFTQLLSTDAEVRDSSPQLEGEPALDSAQLSGLPAGGEFFEVGPLPGIEGKVRVLATPAGSDGVAVLVVGASLDDRDEALSSLLALLVGGIAVTLALTSAAGYLAIGLALRPVDSMRRRAAEISALDVGQRLPVSAADDEISRLGKTLNEMLDRLERGIERERRFVDDASHELRTPLASLKAELEVALRYEGDPDGLRRAMASAVEEADRVVQLADDLLVLARSDKGRLSIDLQPLEAADLMQCVAERFGARATESGRAVAVEVPPGLVVEGDRLRLEQALGNLVDNALRHGAGPVTLRADQQDEVIELHVLDRGAGFPDSLLPRAFARFGRADAGRSEPGAGLGLAIVAAITSAHRGSAGAGNRSGGGADAWLSLPAG